MGDFFELVDVLFDAIESELSDSSSDYRVY